MPDLEAIRARWQAATPGPWHWDSYSKIIAEVDAGHPLDCEPDDSQLNVNGKKVAILAYIDGGTRQRGDELQEPEARANAEAIAAAPEDVDWLIGQVDRQRELLRRVEWEGHPGNPMFGMCPTCRSSQQVGHAPDCELAAALKGEVR